MERRPGEPRPLVVRVAAGVTAAVLALALPVLFVLFAVAGDRWRPLISVLLALSVAVPLVFWLVALSARRRREAADLPRADGQ